MADAQSQITELNNSIAVLESNKETSNQKFRALLEEKHAADLHANELDDQLKESREKITELLTQNEELEKSGLHG